MYGNQGELANTSFFIQAGPVQGWSADIPDEYAAALRVLGAGNYARAALLIAPLWNRDPEPFMKAMIPAGQNEADRLYAGLKMLGDKREGAEKYTISPALAKKMLRYNHDNRAVSRTQLEATLKAIAAGKWKSNGVNIVLARCGRLSDGQHRLIACFLLGVPFESLISYGSEFDARDTIDIGKRRQPGDRLAMKRITDGHTIAAISTLVFRIIHSRKPADLEGDEFFEANQEKMLEARRLGGLAAQKPRAAGWNLSAFCAAAFLLLDGGAEPARVREFMVRFSTGENLRAGQSILTLRNYLGSKNDLSREQLARTVVAHYNQHRLGRSQKTLIRPLDIIPVEQG